MLLLSTPTAPRSGPPVFWVTPSALIAPASPQRAQPLLLWQKPPLFTVTTRSSISVKLFITEKPAVQCTAGLLLEKGMYSFDNRKRQKEKPKTLRRVLGYGGEGGI